MITTQQHPLTLQVHPLVLNLVEVALLHLNNSNRTWELQEGTTLTLLLSTVNTTRTRRRRTIPSLVPPRTLTIISSTNSTSSNGMANTINSGPNPSHSTTTLTRLHSALVPLPLKTSNTADINYPLCTMTIVSSRKLPPLATLSINSSSCRGMMTMMERHRCFRRTEDMAGEEGDGRDGLPMAEAGEEDRKWVLGEGMEEEPIQEGSIPT